jgi:hypothetical protein
VDELWELAALIRSKNAGPFELTFDVILRDRHAYDRVLASGVLEAPAFAARFGVAVDDVRVHRLERILAIKVSIPRPVVSGDIEDTDVFGGQFHSPLVRLRIP